MTLSLGLSPLRKLGDDRRRAAARPRLENLEGRALMAVSVLLNELDSYPYPANYPNQYVEIETVNSDGSIAPNTPLTGYEFARFDGYNNGNPVGKALLVVDLSGHSTGANGLLIIEADNTGPNSNQPPNNPGPPVPDPNTTVVHLANFDLGNSLVSLGNGTNTYAIVNTNGGSKLTQNAAYDPNNTGVLTLPAGDTFSDGISFTYHSQPGNSSDQAYLPYLNVSNPPSGSPISPNAITRVDGNTTVTLTPNVPLGTGSQWYGGYLNAYSTDYDPMNSVNLPSNGGELTPGWANVPVVQLSSPSYSVVKPGIGSKTLNLTLNVTNGAIPAGASVQATTADITTNAGINYAPLVAKTINIGGNSTNLPISIKNGTLGNLAYEDFSVVVGKPQVNGAATTAFLIAPAGGGLAAGNLYSVEQPSVATVYITSGGVAPPTAAAADVATPLITGPEADLLGISTNGTKKKN